MNFKRIVALIITLCMAATALASCSNGGTANTRDPDATDTDTQFKSADYAGEEFTFFTNTISTSTNEYYCGQWIDAEAINGTATNDAVFKRNLACEEKYNIKINEKMGKSQSMEELESLYMAGDYCFDVVYGWGVHLGSVVTDGYFTDFKDLDTNGYINLEADYWAPAANESLTIADRMFLATNDISMAKLSWSGCLFYNPQIIENTGLEDPQTLVESNKWTIDKFLEMVKAANYDLDGVAGITKEDVYGYITLSSANTEFLKGCGVTNTVKDSDGLYQLSIGDTKVINLIEKVRGTLTAKGTVFSMEQILQGADTSGYDQWEYTRSYFAKGHSLFLGGSPELTREMKAMEGGYGIVPLPKYDENQADYIAPIDSCSGIFAIPNTVRTDGQSTASLERTGTILEYLAYKSGEEGSVVDAYFETTIKGQRMTIEKNKDMLEIVKNAGQYEWTDIFGLEISDTLGKMYEKQGIQSTYDSSKIRLQKSLDDIYDEFLALQ